MRLAVAAAVLAASLTTPAAAAEPQSALEAFVKMSRAGLTAFGFEKRSIDGLTYFVGGDGPAVVLLHGSNDQAGTWGTIAAPLAAKYRFILPDLPGHGESAPDGGPIAFETILSGVERLLEKETSGEVVIGGNSLGGWVALHVALRNPDRIRGLVLESATAIRYEGDPPPLLPKNRDEARRAMAAVLGSDSPIPDAMLDELVRSAPASPMARMATPALEKWLLDEQLGAIAAPAVVIWGDADGVLPLSYGEALAAKLPNARLEVARGCGHIPHLHCAATARPLFASALERLSDPE
jgi:pimeloyl-ACP methyl ester carboxylesterase